MATNDRRDLRVLSRQRDATRYRILVEIAERQPAVSQREIADSIGVTAQAVSEYMGALIEDGYIDKRGRGRYEITNEGVDWLITRTDELRSFTEYVEGEIIDRVEIDAALATGDIEEGGSVSLFMDEGVLHAAPGGHGQLTAVAVTAAAAGDVVGVSDFEGLIDYEWGTVRIVTVPPISDGPTDVDPSTVTELIEGYDMLAVAGIEALSVVDQAGETPDIQFGSPEAVREAATRGLDVLLITVEPAVSTHTDRLREANVNYEVLDLTESEPGLP